MFQTENEDYFPRNAPKPSNLNLAITDVRPTVPEISIVFPQTQPESEFSTNSQASSYSVWKNKCLLPTNAHNDVQPLMTELPRLKLSNNYSANNAASGTNIPLNYHGRQIAFSKPDLINKEGCSSSTQTNLYAESQHSKKTYCVSSEITQLEDQKDNVSTNCVGTQTCTLAQSAYQTKPPASKEDVEEIKCMIMEMRNEHRSLLQIIQNLLKENKIPVNKPESKDVGIQSDTLVYKGDLNAKSSRETDFPCEEDIMKNENQNPNTSKLQTKNCIPICKMSKPVTERSMVMNELAVKYLPNVKLTDMLEEAQTGSKVRNRYEESALKNIENIDRSPVELSTASYKYLRKYRLLPGENNNSIFSLNNEIQELNTEHKQEGLLDLEMIRCKPKFL